MADEFKAGDPCASCGSTRTYEIGPVEGFGCADCGACDDDE